MTRILIDTDAVRDAGHQFRQASDRMAEMVGMGMSPLSKRSMRIIS